ncbi:hypothetical protein UFOVP71_138 [uncultured Caudovirales phage]|uniref:Uncharacterized protein n=1 Tax=uncultured Caudovirales phage TaxID=2100421 RepID=A0A6J5TD93_9CAUD|nr:hypothetical protein UFOVP71_138 [uncultured Caudovirales phage]
MSIYYQPTRRESIGGNAAAVKNPVKPPKPPVVKPMRTKPKPKPRPPKPKYSDVTQVTAVAFTIPLLIRLMELVHEAVESDEDLHFLLEKIIAIGLNELLDMNDYDEIVSVLYEYPEEVYPEDYTTQDSEE